ncbi:sporulation integral membrane protein YtvI [Dorea sp. AF36-15AT]|uniref:sporulation integral membrane protein YtvI n=1 Tax=Dorea sp. AF36-15AT TaxID=2292041 RepID=UPI000E48139C|nr:sporulation integral membrane protein YtvI [Dorea sp. AF36-15AT]RHP10525.1 sporulation integral membrane protein YtvI [Dorea sp. AF36-15AT]
MSVKEDLGDTRPYWKVLVSLVFSLTATVLFIYVGIKAIFYFMPFVIGWILSVIAGPLVTFLEKKLKIMKRLGSAITIILVLALCIGLIYLIISQIWEEISVLIRNFPSMYHDLERGLSQIGTQGNALFERFPEQIQNSWATLMNNLDDTASSLIGRIGEPTIEVAGNVAKRIPSVLIGTIVAFVSAYFFIADKENLGEWVKKVVPKSITSRLLLVGENLKYAMGGYFKAQFKIMGVVFAILLVGFTLMQIRFSILLAIAIAFLDFLPFFGTGTALIPWAIYKFLVGDYKMVAALVILYGVTQLVRQLIQPKLVGDSMGLNPLYTLFLLYLGYRVGSVLGMIFAVPIGLILLNLYQAGAFDYILNDVKILAEGILSLRE